MPGRYERQVDLCIFGTAFARATSTVSLDREDCVRAIEDEGVAIGQLFAASTFYPNMSLKRPAFDYTAHAQAPQRLLMSMHTTNHRHRQLLRMAFLLLSQAETQRACLRLRIASFGADTRSRGRASYATSTKTSDVTSLS